MVPRVAERQIEQVAQHLEGRELADELRVYYPAVEQRHGAARADVEQLRKRVMGSAVALQLAPQADEDGEFDEQHLPGLTIRQR